MAAIKILSVDDEAPLELLMKQYFRRKIRNGEYEFFFAHNGLEALSLLYNNPDIEIIQSRRRRCLDIYRCLHTDAPFL